MIEAEKKKRRLNARDVFDNHRGSTPNVVLFSRAITQMNHFLLHMSILTLRYQPHTKNSQHDCSKEKVCIAAFVMKRLVYKAFCHVYVRIR